jgi:hypothetical protein
MIVLLLALVVVLLILVDYLRAWLRLRSLGMPYSLGIVKKLFFPAVFRR